MVEKQSQSIEVSRLLNSAFCGRIILYCIRKYQKFSPSGMPYPLIFFILPTILHAETRTKIPSISRKHFHAWLMQNQSILINYPERVRDLVPTTKKTLVFLTYLNQIEFNKGLIKIKKFSSKSNESTSLEVQECFLKAEVLGKWLASTGSLSTTYSMLGVIP